MKFLSSIFASATVALALAACDPTSTESRFGEQGPFTVQTVSGQVHYRSTNDYVFKKMAETIGTPTKLRAFLNNTTSQEFNEYHGTQIEYLGADGRTYLWYPGNRSALAGRWTIQNGTYGESVCFQYGSNSYNPVTHASGTAWDCTPVGIYVFDKLTVVSGDIFHLASGNIPYVLPSRTNISLEDAARQAGLPGGYRNKADWGAMMAAEKAASAGQ
jgi:hypothetical protein